MPLRTHLRITGCISGEAISGRSPGRVLFISMDPPRGVYLDGWTPPLPTFPDRRPCTHREEQSFSVGHMPPQSRRTLGVAPGRQRSCTRPFGCGTRTAGAMWPEATGSGGYCAAPRTAGLITDAFARTPRCAGLLSLHVAFEVRCCALNNGHEDSSIALV